MIRVISEIGSSGNGSGRFNAISVGGILQTILLGGLLPKITFKVGMLDNVQEG